MQGARELIENLRRAGHRIILASSGKQFEVDHYLDLLEIRDLVDGWTTSADVDRTKPDPDLVLAALEKGGEDGDKKALMIGDSPFDALAATKAGISTVAVMTGGFSRQELKDAGAVEVFDTLAELGDYLLNRVGARVDLAPPTPPSMRVRTRRFARHAEHGRRTP